MSEIILTVDGVELIDLFGEKNVKLKLFKEYSSDVTVTARGNTIKIVGEKKYTQKAKSKMEQMIRILKDHKELTTQMVEDLMLNNNPFENKISNSMDKNTIVYGRRGVAIKARTVNQKKMVELSEANDILFAIGPAGTGKTYLSVALAVRSLKNKLVKRIILTRPAVEAGENLGFLPGDMKDKVDPYLRPLYDALDDLIPIEKLNFFIQNRIIEIAPIAFMRGRTLDNAFIILDEAQNATSAQLKMFLTRLGPTAKCIITGDLTQIDLKGREFSGLYKSMEILENIDGIARIDFNAEDVVRHRLVKEIIKAYELENKKRKAEQKPKDNNA